MGMWLITLHWAFWPQAPGQGSTHLFFIHALSFEQSVLNTHSGRQLIYGLPKYSGKQVQMPLSHWALGPQGDLLHGSITGSSTSVSTSHIYEMLSHIVQILSILGV